MLLCCFFLGNGVFCYRAIGAFHYPVSDTDFYVQRPARMSRLSKVDFFVNGQTIGTATAVWF